MKQTNYGNKVAVQALKTKHAQELGDIALAVSRDKKNLENALAYSHTEHQFTREALVQEKENTDHWMHEYLALYEKHELLQARCDELDSPDARRALYFKSEYLTHQGKLGAAYKRISRLNKLFMGAITLDIALWVCLCLQYAPK